MKLTPRITSMGLALAGLLLISGVAPAQPAVEAFYRGKTVQLVVSAEPGTPTDIIARQFARYFSQQIPGKPQAIVINVAGAGGMVAAASLQMKQPSDGTAIGFLQRNNLYVPLLEPRANGFDPRKVKWLGSLEKINYALVAMPRSGVTTADELFKKKLTIGATGFSNENRTMPALINEYLGAKMKIVPGYSGRGEVYLAMQRGEVDGWAPTIDGLKEGEPARLIANGEMKVLLHMGWKSHPDFPNVPNLSAYPIKPEGRAVFDFFLTPFDAGRPLAVPAGVPTERVEALRAALARTVANPEFKAAAKAQGFPIDAIDGAAVEQIVAKLYSTPPAVIETARKLRNK